MIVVQIKEGVTVFVDSPADIATICCVKLSKNLQSQIESKKYMLFMYKNFNKQKNN